MEKGKERQVNDNDKVKASWNEHYHSLFVRICLEQMRLGNKPSHTLNKDGYKNMEIEFFKETGLRYTRTQFKNHWDATRRDWQAWADLRKSTGMGWDNVKNTFTQTREWWTDFAKRFPGGDKFAEHPLKHESDLDILFGGGAAIGSFVIIPSSGHIPEESSETSRTKFPEVEQNTNEKNSEQGDVTSSAGVGAKRGASPPREDDDVKEVEPTQATSSRVDFKKPAKRPKMSSAQRLETCVKDMCNVLKERTKCQEAQVPVFSISKAMELLNEVSDLEKMSDEWLFAASLLRNSSTRELFVALGDPDTRCAWIKREYKLAYS